MKNDEIKNLLIAIVLSVAVIFLANRFLRKDVVVEDKPIETSSEPKANKVVAEVEKKEVSTTVSLDEALALSSRILVDNKDLEGSIRVMGSRIDNLLLKKYRQTLDEDSPHVELFVPAKTTNPYYAEFGWLAADGETKVPNSQTVWSTDSTKLTPENPIVLEWDNGDGLKFINKISVDDNYMFSLEQTVENDTAQEVELYPYGLIARAVGETKSASVVHEGLIGVVNDTLEEIKYKDLEEENEEFETTGGWLGFSDRYWFSAMVLNPEANYKLKFSRNDTLYQADYLGNAVVIAAGGAAHNSSMLYAGAKEIKLLDKYADDLKISKFDLAVDFGLYYFLTKPFFYILDFLYKLIGNMGWAILLFAALLRLVMFPIANKSYESMAKMKLVQPKLKELQEKYADDKAKLQKETMALYSREKINPASGCLPIFIQIPVFFSLYKVLNIAIEIRQAPFVGWIKDLSAPDPLTISVITGLTFIPGIIDIGVWPILMGITMYIQQKLNPAPANPDQARMFAMLPIIFTFMMGHFASGLVIYWTLSNIMAILQQRAIIYKNKGKHQS